MNEKTDKPKNSQNYELTKTVVLTGMMGCGKSAIGRRLAAQLGLDFKDSDTEIEQAAAMSVSEIFDQHGEAYFRDGEKRVIERLLHEPAHIMAIGGGAFCQPQTRALIQQHACSIWLKTDLDELVRRVNKRPGKRPLLANGDPKDILARLLEERAPDYEKADLTIVSSSGTHQKTVKAVIAELTQCGILISEGDKRA